MNQSKPLKIFITGIAGTGKSAIATELQKRGINSIDIDHVPGLCAWVHNETGEKVTEANPDNAFIDQYDYQCDIGMLQELMNKSEELVIVCGSVGDNSTLLPLFDKTFLFQCSPETLLKRLRTRDSNDFAKNEAVQDRMLEWRKIFDVLMLNASAVPINTDRPFDMVVEEVIKKIVTVSSLN
jgi:dephospho-CoA kinase